MLSILMVWNKTERISHLFQRPNLKWWQMKQPTTVRILWQVVIIAGADVWKLFHQKWWQTSLALDRGLTWFPPTQVERQPVCEFELDLHQSVSKLVVAGLPERCKERSIGLDNGVLFLHASFDIECMVGYEKGYEGQVWNEIWVYTTLITSWYISPS